MAILRQYETTYILQPNLEDDERAKAMERIDGVIGKFDGTIARTDDWGLRKLAYPIRKESRGEYIYMRYTAPAETILELERIMRLMVPVMKFLTVRLDSDAPDAINPWEAPAREDGDEDDSDRDRDRDRD